MVSMVRGWRGTEGGWAGWAESDVVYQKGHVQEAGQTTAGVLLKQEGCCNYEWAAQTGSSCQ